MRIAKRTTFLCLAMSASLPCAAQQKPSPLAPYVKEDAPVLVLEHVRVIDGTGSAPQEYMRIDMAGPMLKKEMSFEREFVAAGGLLMAGCDPTGYGGVVPGFGDQRNIELLAEAGFSPVEAIRIATLNGAIYMGRDASIGSIAPGKAADLVVLGGNPAEKIENVEKVELVFKDGVGFDSAKLIRSVSELVGVR
jgi:Amidohydrolase family